MLGFQDLNVCACIVQKMISGCFSHSITSSTDLLWMYSQMAAATYCSECRPEWFCVVRDAVRDAKEH